MGGTVLLLLLPLKYLQPLTSLSHQTCSLLRGWAGGRAFILLGSGRAPETTAPHSSTPTMERPAPWERLQAEFAAVDGAALHSGESVNLVDWLREQLACDGAAATIPCLSGGAPHAVDALADGTLVRFSGMVQDVRDPEYYDGAYELVARDGTAALRTTKYQGTLMGVPAGHAVRSRPDAVWQRTPVVCVPMPARTAWLDAALTGVPSPAAPTTARAAAAKRAMAAEGGGGTMGEAAMEQMMDVEPTGSKRTRRPAGGGADAEDVPRTSVPLAGDGGAAAARADVQGRCGVCDDGRGAAAAWARASALGGVLLKVYDALPEEELRLHELVEVYGLLERADEMGGASMDALAAVDAAGATMQSLLDAQVEAERRQRPPPSAQPRVHVIALRRIPDAHAALLPAPSTTEEQLAAAAAKAGLPQMRHAVLLGLAAALGGDQLAAEHVLLAVLSRTLSRHGDAPVGKMHLHISGCPPPSEGAAASPVASALHGALSALLPVCCALPLTTQALNAGGLVPTKDHDANCIWPAALQLPNGAVLLMDEAMLAPGQLTESGVKSLGALRALAESQLLQYDFTYFTVDVPLDTTLIVTSSGLSSMLPIRTSLPLRVQPNAAPPPAETSTSDWLDAARRYLGLVVRAQHRLVGAAQSAEAAKAMEDDFVAARRANPKVSADDFAHWLTCARILAASTLEGQVEMSHYEHARKLDAERCSRLHARDVAL